MKDYAKVSVTRICTNRTHKSIERMLVDWFPSVGGIKFSHNWSGPVGVPGDWMPSVKFDPGT